MNGLVLAADGKKMSKRLKNYPNPQSIVDSHGADAVRMYLCNSPVVRAEPLRFRENGVRDIVKEWPLHGTCNNSPNGLKKVSQQVKVGKMQEVN